MFCLSLPRFDNVYKGSLSFASMDVFVDCKMTLSYKCIVRIVFDVFEVLIICHLFLFSVEMF